MTYASGTWSTTKYLENKLQSAQRAMEQEMVKISLRDKVRSLVITKQTGVTNAIVRYVNMKQSKWIWLSHVSRRNDNR